MNADLNLVDSDVLQLQVSEIVHDLPAGGKHLVQKVEGYEATIVSGEAILERGIATEARPGVLVRSGRL